MKNKFWIDEKKGIFRKYYRNLQELEKEKWVYDRKLSFIPHLLKVNNDEGEFSCDFTYINGCNLWDKDKIDFSAIGICYAELHNITDHNGKSLCQIDTNPQNIIFEQRSGKYFLIDFVDWRWEYPEFDLVHFLLFWAEISTSNQFISITRYFLKGYYKIREFDLNRWLKTFNSAIHYFDNRREKYNKSEKFVSQDRDLNRKFLETSMNIRSVLLND